MELENNYKKLNIDWIPQKNINEPLYKQIIKYFNMKIASGDWPVGTVLPSQRDLAEIFQVNRSTVTTAIDELSSYGVLEGVVGKGTMVKSNTWSLMLPQNISNWGNYIQSGTFKENNHIIQTIKSMEEEKKFRKISIGELSPSLFPKNFIQNSMHKAVNTIDNLGYLESLGLYELREIIAQRLRRKNIDVGPKNILITSGSLQGLQLISICMLKAGTVVYTESPSYLGSLQVFQSAGMNLKGLSLDSDGVQYWNMDRKDFLENSPVLYTIPTNQNPTGTIMTPQRRQDLYDFCMENRIPIIEDDAYGDLSYNDDIIYPIKSLDENGLVIYLGTISKILAPGFRIGWIVGAESVISRLADAKMQVDYGASSLSQIALAEILSSTKYDDYIADLNEKLAIKRNLMLASLEKYFKDYATWNTPQGGLFIWLELNKNIPIEKLFREAAEHDILLNPGYAYDYEKNRCIRLSFSYIENQLIDETLLNLSKLIAKYFM